MPDRVEENQSWTVIVPPERLEEFLDQQLFADLLVLMRIQNTIRFTHHALVAHSGEPSAPDQPEEEMPSRARARNNAFLHTAAVLWEALRAVRPLGRSFRELESWSRMTAIFRDRAVEELEARVLYPARNSIVFHFDGPAMIDGIRAIETSGVLARGYGRTTGESYYELADIGALAHLVEQGSDEETAETRLTEVIGAVTELSIRLTGALDNVIGEAAKNLGLTMDVHSS